MRHDLGNYTRQQIFINHPFDSDFTGLADAMGFTIVSAGLIPISALDLSSPDRPRLEMLIEAFQNCRYSAHDLSRLHGEGAQNFARMNMPLEMGMALYHALSTQKREHRCVFFVPTPHDYKLVVSDLAGLDPKVHDGDEARLVADLYDRLP